MSRIGKQKMIIPEKVTVKQDGLRVVIEGPLGKNEREFPTALELTLANNRVSLHLRRPAGELNALWGTYAAHLKNMIRGVTTGFEKRLLIEGIGYKAAVSSAISGTSGETLTLQVGFSHPVALPIPFGLKVAVDKGLILVSGIDCELVGQFAAKVRAIRPPDAYKEKGIRYFDETVIRKQGKKVVT